MKEVTHSRPQLCDCSIVTKSSVSCPKLKAYRTVLPLGVIGMLTLYTGFIVTRLTNKSDMTGVFPLEHPPQRLRIGRHRRGGGIAARAAKAATSTIPINGH